MSGDVDELQIALGEFGPFQRKVYFLVIIPAVFCAWTTLSYVFIAATPSYRYSRKAWITDSGWKLNSLWPEVKTFQYFGWGYCYYLPLKDTSWWKVWPFLFNLITMGCSARFRYKPEIIHQWDKPGPRNEIFFHSIPSHPNGFQLLFCYIAFFLFHCSTEKFSTKKDFSLLCYSIFF